MRASPLGTANESACMDSARRRTSSRSSAVGSGAARIYVHAGGRPGRAGFARTLGVEWVGDSDTAPPDLLDAANVFAQVGALVPRALAAMRKGGRVVCGGIHMSNIPEFPYALLWGERQLVSVANLTRRDAEAFFPVAQAASIRTTTVHRLGDANVALDDIRLGRLRGAAVLVP